MSKTDNREIHTAIIYYSMNGNTATVAEKLARELPADLIEIRPETAYPDHGIRKFLWGGKSAVMAETPKLLPYTFDTEAYDRIIFGFPVWASNMAPPVRSFVKENRPSLLKKRVSAFACQSGSGGEKALKKLCDLLGLEKLEATVILIDPKDRPKTENDQKIREFVKKLQEA